MDYANTYKNAYVRFHASDMILEADSDAAYLVMPKAKSRYAGYFRLLNKENTPNRSIHNGALLIDCKTIKNVVSSAAEAETHGVFNNVKTALFLRHLLSSLGHEQPPTTLHTDNSTTSGFIHNNIQLKKSKSWDMNLHWLREKELLKKIKIKWDKGVNNTGDYFTKHHSITHHRKMRPFYVKDLIQKVNSIYHTLLIKNIKSEHVCKGVLIPGKTGIS